MPRNSSEAHYFGRRRGGDRRGWPLRLVAIVVKIILFVMTKRKWSGMQNIPLQGGAIFACNHISQADPLTVAHFVYNAGRNPQFLAKAEVFSVPVAGKIIESTGQTPVYRGGPDAVRSLHAAIDTVARGETVIFYPEGTTSKHPDNWPMRGRTGVARLAIETGAPVIPLAVWGPQRIFNPVRRKLRPWPRTRVTVVAGEPVDLSAWDGAEPDTETLTAMTETIMLRVRDQLAAIRGEKPPPLYDMKKSVNSTGEDT